jgi:hypothetical protein
MFVGPTRRVELIYQNRALVLHAPRLGKGRVGLPPRTLGDLGPLDHPGPLGCSCG